MSASSITLSRSEALDLLAVLATSVLNEFHLQDQRYKSADPIMAAKCQDIITRKLLGQGLPDDRIDRPLDPEGVKGSV